MVHEDALAVAQNGGVSSSDEGELDGDDDLDDDMMDKISSSPSIEDGGCYPVAPVAWPRRVSSLPSSIGSSAPFTSGSSGTRVDSPYPAPLKHITSTNTIALPSRALPEPPAHFRSHRLQGEYTDCYDTDDNKNDAESDDDESWDTFNSTVEFLDHGEETKAQQATARYEKVQIGPISNKG